MRFGWEPVARGLVCVLAKSRGHGAGSWEATATTRAKIQLSNLAWFGIGVFSKVTAASGR
jgi:hypothetical protein